MKIKKQLLQVYVIFFLYVFPVIAQPLTKSENCKEIYQVSNELFNAANYGAALFEFKKLRDYSDSGSAYYDEADYFIRVCELEMGNSNGKVGLERFIELNPGSPRINNAYFRLGDSEFKLKRYSKALSLFKKIDRYGLTGSELEEYCFKMGFCNLEAGNKDIAKVLFAEVKEKQGKFTEASCYYWAHICYLEGKYDTALHEFEKLESSAQFGSLVPLYKAQIFFAQEKYEQVTKMASELFNHSSEDRKAELSKVLGVSYYQLKKYPEALPYIEIYLKDKDVTPRQYYVAGYCYNKSDHTEKAIVNFEKSVGGKDELAQNGYYELADLYIRSGDKKKALMAFQNASNFDFDSAIKEDALFQYAKITYELNYSPFNEAIKAFDRYISAYPNSEKSGTAYDYLGKVFMTTRNFKDALASLDKIKVKSISIKKAYQRVALNRGIEFFRDLNFQEAIQHFNKSLLYGEQNSEFKALAYYWRGESNFRLGKIEDSVADYKKFQAVPGASKLKEFPISNYNIGYAFFNNEEYEKAVQWFVKYTEGKINKNLPLFTDALNRIGDCSFVSSRFSEAITYYQQAYENGSSDSDYALFQKAFCHGLMNDNAVKIDDLNLLQSEFKTSNYIDDAIFETGKSWERLQDNNKAVENYLSLISKFPSSPYKPKALVQLGLIAYNQNDFDQSTNYFKQVAENYPNSPEAKGALAGIRNNYLENNKVGDYIAYAKTLGHSASPSQNEEDSLTYYAAEKLYMAKDPRAIDQLNKYLDNFPTGNFALNIHFYRGEMEYSANNSEEALLSFDFILSQPNNIFTENALLRGSEIAFKAGNFQKSLDYYQRLEGVSGNTTNTLISLAGRLRCYYELKQFDEVAKIGWRIRSMEKIPSELDREACFKSAKAYVELNDPLKALPLWRKLSVDSKSLEGAEAKYRVCEYYLSENKFKEAENEVNDFIEKSTPHQYWLGKSFLLLAHVYAGQNDFFQATNTLKSIIENYEQKDDGILDEANKYLQTLEAKDDSGSVKPALKTDSSIGVSPKK